MCFTQWFFETVMNQMGFTALLTGFVPLRKMQKTSNTICALATGGGMSAIAVIRISGPEAFSIGDKLFRGKIRLQEAAGNTIHFGKIVHDSQWLDEVLVSVFRAPHSYTGENTLEISCHGSPYIQQQILQALYAVGAQPASAGEFTLRAFLHGKIDLSQAEAVADLIASENQASHQLALRQLRGGYSEIIRGLRDELLRFAALIELELDFSTEDVEFADRKLLEVIVKDVIGVLSQLRDSYALGNVLKAGIPVTIAGRPNAGKSTLLNALLKEERAIVTPVAGTTRDTIEDEMVLHGVRFRFIDTAGLRHTTDEVEKLGIERSYDKIKQAEIVLYLFDVLHTSKEEVYHDLAEIRQLAGEQRLLIAVGNKADLLTAKPVLAITEPLVWISAKTNQGLKELEDLLLQRINSGKGQKDEHLVTNARHFDAINRALISLEHVIAGLHNQLPGDLLAMDLRAALHDLSGIVGEVYSDDVLGAIFSKFCIGK